MSAFYLDRYEVIFELSGKHAGLSSMHLQWFAAEDEGRTEEPTEHKIRKAREEGKVAKSADLASSIVLLFAVITLAATGGYFLKTSAEMLVFFIKKSGEVKSLADGTLFSAFLSYFIRLALPVSAACFLSAILGNVVQFGLLFSTKPITPDFERIAPNFSRFVQRTLFSTEALFNLSKALLKVAIIGLIAYLNIQADMKRITNMIRVPFMQSFTAVSSVTLRILVESTIVLLFLAIVDFIFQRRQHIESLKMSKQEIIEERKAYEGDPLVRSRLRQRMRELLSRNMIQNVPKADVVVTNPTHFAVAMEYKNESMEAPVVTAKGQDHIAENIKRVARENEVPIIENKPLARALYAELEIGDSIPVKYYEAVAAVLRQVYSLNERKRRAG